MASFREDIRDIANTASKLFSKHRITIFFISSFFITCYFLPNNQYFTAINNYKNSIQARFTENILNIKQYLNYHSKLAHDKYNAEKQQILLLHHKIQLLESQLTDYQFLNEKLDYVPFHYNAHIAKVIKLNQNEYEKNIYISGGSIEYSVGDIVLDQEGVLGVIDQVEQTYSRVMLYNDPTFKISAIGKKSGNRYILTGTGEDNTLRIQYIDNRTYTILEEDLMTSGEDKRYYSGLPLGRLTSQYEKYVVSRKTDFIENPFVFVIGVMD